MPPPCVKAYVKRGKTDAADAEAIAEAVTRPTMRFVDVKTTAQQAVLMRRKSRAPLVRQRTMLINAEELFRRVRRGRAAGLGGGPGRPAVCHSLQRDRLPELAQAALRGLAG